jgi:hypothetical protein
LKEIALLIAGDAAPEWLPKLLGEWKDGVLTVSRLIAGFEPTPTQLRSSFGQLQEAADLIIHEIYSPTTRGFLGAPSAGVISDELLGAALIDLIKRVESADKHRAVTDAAGRTKRGRGRARTPGRLPPEIVCAVVVTETWRYFRGETPRPGNREIATIAEKFWRLAGGAVHVAVEDPLARWKPRFVAALKGVSDPQRGVALQELREAIPLRLREREHMSVTSISRTKSAD